jgi:hypothetical protein
MRILWLIHIKRRSRPFDGPAARNSEHSDPDFTPRLDFLPSVLTRIVAHLTNGALAIRAPRRDISLCLDAATNRRSECDVATHPADLAKSREDVVPRLKSALETLRSYRLHCNARVPK